MIDQPRIVQSTAQPAAVIRLTIPRSEIRSVMGPAREELMATLAAQGIAPAGPWFSRHFKMDPAIFDFEVGVPVSEPITPTGRVQAGHLPASRVARAVLHGDYQGLGPAWGELDAWIKAEGHTRGPGLWEVYLAGPEASADPASWRTELNRPLND